METNWAKWLEPVKEKELAQVMEKRKVLTSDELLEKR